MFIIHNSKFMNNNYVNTNLVNTNYVNSCVASNCNTVVCDNIALVLLDEIYSKVDFYLNKMLEAEEGLKLTLFYPCTRNYMYQRHTPIVKLQYRFMYLNYVKFVKLKRFVLNAQCFQSIPYECLLVINKFLLLP